MKKLNYKLMSALTREQLKWYLNASYILIWLRHDNALYMYATIYLFKNKQLALYLPKNVSLVIIKLPIKIYKFLKQRLFDFYVILNTYDMSQICQIPMQFMACWCVNIFKSIYPAYILLEISYNQVNDLDTCWIFEVKGMWITDDSHMLKHIIQSYQQLLERYNHIQLNFLKLEYLPKKQNWFN